MPGFKPLKSVALVCEEVESVEVNTTHNLNTVLAALTGGSPPSGGSYGEVWVLISNSGTDLAYICTAADLLNGETPITAETAAATNLVIPAGTTTAAPKQFGPFKWNGSDLPLLRLLDGASVLVTFMVGAS